MQQSEVADYQQATEIQKAWLAGIIDGEGSIRIDVPHHKQGGSPRIVVTNNDLTIIAKVVDIYKAMGINPHLSARTRGEFKTYDVIILGIKKLLIALRALMPYLSGTKQDQAILLYRFCESRVKLNVKKLANSERKYNSQEIEWIHQIKGLKKDWSLRDYTTDRKTAEDIVRATGRPVEAGRNAQPRLISE